MRRPSSRVSVVARTVRTCSSIKLRGISTQRSIRATTNAKRSASGTFSLDSQTAAHAPAPASGARLLGGIDALIALQGFEEPGERDRGREVAGDDEALAGPARVGGAPRERHRGADAQRAELGRVHGGTPRSGQRTPSAPRLVPLGVITSFSCVTLARATPNLPASADLSHQLAGALTNAAKASRPPPSDSCGGFLAFGPRSVVIHCGRTDP